MNGMMIEIQTLELAIQRLSKEKMGGHCVCKWHEGGVRLILLHVGVLGEGESGVCRPSVSTETTRCSVQPSVYAHKCRKE